MNSLPIGGRSHQREEVTAGSLKLVRISAVELIMAQGRPRFDRFYFTNDPGEDPKYVCLTQYFL